DPIPLVEVCPSPVIAQKAMTQEKAPSPGLGFVKLDFLIGTKWGSKPGGSKSPPSQEPEPAEETSLSERRIKTLPISPYSSKTWRENPPKVLIPKDRPWEGVPPLPTSNHHTQKNTSFQATTKKFIFGRTDGEPPLRFS